ncbi:MAG: RnfABCDGE type electron transport complex subunit D [Candidatus Aenigmarchaeota archaeon]|nr:RnfABCDGE type electron transport complex subunit D [Candidatus Aenigmarchaeota archaeon]
MKYPEIIRLDIYSTILLFLYVMAAVVVYLLGLKALIVLAETTLAAAILDSVIYKIRKRDVTLRTLRKALITSALVAFLVPPGTPAYAAVAASVMAILSKHLIRLPKKKHIFNPAAFGTLLASLAFGFPISWWGSSVPALTWFLGIALIYKFRRLELPVTLLVTYLLLSMIGNYTGFSMLLENMPLVFMSFFMAPEPITSPYTRNGRILFGVLAGVAIFALGFVGRLDILLGGLLLANLSVQPINMLLKPKINAPATIEQQQSL